MEHEFPMIHERVMELLTTVQPRVFSSLTPGKIIDLFKLGEGKPSKLGTRTSDIGNGFYAFLGFTRLTTSDVIRRAIARGVQEGAFGYIAGTVPDMGDHGKYQVSFAKVRFAGVVAEDEIDLESGFIMMPQAIPLPLSTPAPGPTPVPPTGTGTVTAGGGDVSEPPGPGAGPVSPSVGASQKVVEISFSADRSQLFTAWNAVANLADLSGKVSVTLRAECEAGIDGQKLRNGVVEPLREADLIE